MSAGTGKDVESLGRKSVWCCGDRCNVRWSGDGKKYPATVRKIRRRTGGRMVALVRFDGFGSGDDEEIDLDDLRTRNSKKSERSNKPATSDRPLHKEGDDSMFSDGQEDEADRLRRKFELMEKEEELEQLQKPDVRKSWKTTSKRLVGHQSSTSHQNRIKKPTRALPQQTKSVKTERKMKEETPNTRIVKEELGTIPKNTSPRFDFTDSESDDDKPTKTDRSYAGFDDADLEKPSFSHTAHSPKVPLELSAEGEQRKVCVPATINQYLWDYQRDGVRFLYKHHHKGEGAILGDDMGLGKTVQVIAFLSAVLKKTGTKKDVLKQRPKFIRRMSSEDFEEEDEGEKKTFLIIGPASVLYNWVDELETWGYFTIGKFHKHYKDQTLADLKREKLDIVVTTYETFRDNVDILNRFEWEGVIADEAHKIKSMKAEATQALKAIRCRRRFGLTGTALQNDMKELWCILDWANPGYFGSIVEFEEKYVKAILDGQKQDATKRQLAHARKAKEEFAELRNKWFLRRTKALIADQLPKKEELVVYCRPTPFQIDVYKAILGHPHIQLILTRNDPCPCKSGRARGKCHYKRADDGRKINQLLFSYLQMLLKAANHVALLMPEYTTNENQRKQAENICEVVFAQYQDFREQTRVAAFRTLSDPKYCGKMKVLAGILKVFKKEKCKVLLFSLSTQLLDIIEHHIVTTGYEYRRLDGKTQDIKRVQLVREFNQDPGIFLFLSSTKAGGVGLNLTGANVVIIYDPNWNPTHDLQAQDRAYRVGQGRDVRVFRLITMGTVEENIYLRQVYKQQLDRVAVSEENAKRLFHQGEIFGSDNLFRFRDPESCLTKDILERNEKIETSLKGFTVQKYIRPEENDTIYGQDNSKRNRRKNPLQNVESSGENEEDSDWEYGIDNDEEYGKDSDGKDTDNEYVDDTPGSASDDSIPVTRAVLKRSNHVLSSDSESSDDLACGQHGRKVGNVGQRYKDKKPSTCQTRPSPTKNLKIKQERGVPLKEEKAPIGGDKSFIKRKKKDRTIQRSVSTKSEPTPTLASVSDVFNEYGVAHKHENQKLVGASRAEDHMTRCAIQDVYELHQYSQAPAAYCQPLTESSEESDDIGVKQEISVPKKPKVLTKGRKSQVKQKTQTNQQQAMVIGNMKVLIGQTPTAIRKQQFKELASVLGEKDIMVIARKLLASSHGSVSRLLRKFYTDKDGRLAEVFVKEGEDDSSKQKPKSKEHNPKKTCHKKQKMKGNKGCQYSSDEGSGLQKNTLQFNIKQEHRDKSPNQKSKAEHHSKTMDSEKLSKKRTAHDNKYDNEPREASTQSSPMERFLDEIFDSGGEEITKNAPRTSKKHARSSQKQKVCKSPDLQNRKVVGNDSNKDIIDDLFDDSDEDVRRKRSPKKSAASQKMKMDDRRIQETAEIITNKDSKRNLIDDLFDDENKRDIKRKVPPTPKESRKGKIEAACGKVIDMNTSKSILDDLFDDDEDEKHLRKSAPQGKGQISQRAGEELFSGESQKRQLTENRKDTKVKSSKQNMRSHRRRIESDSDDDLFSGVTQTKRKKDNNGDISKDSQKKHFTENRNSTKVKSSYRRRIESDSDDDLFSGVTPTKRTKDNKDGISEDSLDTFARNCKMKSPVLNATMDDFLCDSEPL